MDGDNELIEPTQHVALRWSSGGRGSGEGLKWIYKVIIHFSNSVFISNLKGMITEIVVEVVVEVMTVVVIERKVLCKEY